MIKTTNLTKVYTTEEIETTALNNVDIQIDEGEFVAVMGPSGCGKSTFLNILGLLDSPTSGDYYFMGQNIANYNERQRAQLRKGNIGFIFQSYNLIDELTVFENAELPLLYLGMSTGERKLKVEEALEKMGLSQRRNHFPQQLSGGQQQRVAIARAIVADAKILLADEPTGNLDSDRSNEVMKHLLQLNNQGTTIIMVTHSPHDAGYAQRTLQLFDGKLITDEVPENFYV